MVDNQSNNQEEINWDDDEIYSLIEQVLSPSFETLNEQINKAWDEALLNQDDVSTTDSSTQDDNEFKDGTNLKSILEKNTCKEIDDYDYSQHMIDNELPSPIEESPLSLSPTPFEDVASKFDQLAIGHDNSRSKKGRGSGRNGSIRRKKKHQEDKKSVQFVSHTQVKKKLRKLDNIAHVSYSSSLPEMSAFVLGTLDRVSIYPVSFPDDYNLNSSLSNTHSRALRKFRRLHSISDFYAHVKQKLIQKFDQFGYEMTIEDVEQKHFVRRFKKGGKPSRLVFGFHGTRSKNIQSIRNVGLVVPGKGNEGKNVSVKHGSAYGLGIYVSESFDYSMYYCDNRDTKKMFVVIAKSSPKTKYGFIHCLPENSDVIPIWLLTLKQKKTKT